MTKHKPPNFETINQQIYQALSVLRRHGFKFNLTDELKKRFDNEILFDGDDSLFKDLIKNINIYFEYGCGKSTEYMYKFTKSKIFSVDTSKDWIDKIQSITNNKFDDRLNLKWIDVGDIQDWGQPKSFKMRKNFAHYAKWPWQQNEKPDLVLIDGRFRILCFLTTLKYSPNGTKIIFDDYKDRQFYHVVEEFCPIIDRCGRQALFETNTKAKDMITDEVLLSFQNIIN